MLFKSAMLEGIASGAVTLAFRRWVRPTVRAGGMLRTTVGVLAVESVDTIEAEDITEGDAKRAGSTSRATLLTELSNRPDGTLYRIAFHLADPDPRVALRETSKIDPVSLAAIREKLARLDAGNPWTTNALQLIADHPGHPAQEIADRLGMEKLTAKRRIRQLKELGLTESLEIGYRLSPRGKAFINSAISSK